MEETEVLPLELEGSLLTTMAAVNAEAERAVAHIPGATVEDNKFSVSVHFRNCAEASWLQVRRTCPCTACDAVCVHLFSVFLLRSLASKGYARLEMVQHLGVCVFESLQLLSLHRSAPEPPCSYEGMHACIRSFIHSLLLSFRCGKQWRASSAGTPRCT